jgi:hypothetical protein
MKILHILREEPDATIKDIVASTTNGDQSKITELYSGDIDWSRLVDEIFSHDKVICWW